MNDYTADACIYRWTSAQETEAIRLETEWRREMATAFEAYDRESRAHRHQSAIVAWLVGACLVGLGFILGAIVWAS